MPTPDRLRWLSHLDRVIDRLACERVLAGLRHHHSRRQIQVVRRDPFAPTQFDVFAGVLERLVRAAERPEQLHARTCERGEERLAQRSRELQAGERVRERAVQIPLQLAVTAAAEQFDRPPACMLGGEHGEILERVLDADQVA